MKYSITAATCRLSPAAAQYTGGRGLANEQPTGGASAIERLITAVDAEVDETLSGLEVGAVGHIQTHAHSQSATAAQDEASQKT